MNVDEWCVCHVVCVVNCCVLKWLAHGSVENMLENILSGTVYKNWKKKMKRINYINLFGLLGDENNFLSEENLRK